MHTVIIKAPTPRVNSDAVYRVALGGISIAGKALCRVFGVVGGPHRPVASLRDSFFEEISLVFPGLPTRHFLRINSSLQCGLQRVIA